MTAARLATGASVMALVGLGAACGGESPRRPAPDRPQAVPASVVRQVHRGLHALPRLCRPGDRRLAELTTRFVGWYERYPASRFEMAIDDERATMLSVVLVLRFETRNCAPRQAARVDAVLPERIRRDLTPLRGA